jgi:exopolyphosphatase / guanosine-5'-triphosphate,3'-diphosphate pyrophosphatase
MKRAAILDLGTNTFNLLIAEYSNKLPFKTLVNQKIPVKLGEGRINDGEIIPAAFNRGIEAVKKYFGIIEKYKISSIKAYGTSAFRTAQNGQEFLNLLKKSHDLDVEIITGSHEAELIYLGVRQTLSFTGEKFVILDIGGGSNEFIVADMHNILWKKSYNLGVARLLARFNPTDPISSNHARRN